MKKQDTFYFDNFKDCAEYSLKAANLLDEIMNNYSKDTIKSYVDKMHDIEHSGDKKKHEMLEVLLKAFMTPIERDDILLLSSCLDEVTDKIEDVALRMYCNDIDEIFEPAKEMVKVVIDSCKEMVVMLEEFKNFKKSKSLKDIIIRINTLEEDGDRLFIEGLRVYFQAQNLFTFTKFSGLDPEGVSNIYVAQYPMSRQFTFGFDLTF